MTLIETGYGIANESERIDDFPITLWNSFEIVEKPSEKGKSVVKVLKTI